MGVSCQNSEGKGSYFILVQTMASLVAQMIKNLPAMQEAQVWFLEKEMATHSSSLA